MPEPYRPALPFPPSEPLDALGVAWSVGATSEANGLLAAKHYLGPIGAGRLTILGHTADGALVAAQVWKLPTSRMLPADGTWLELARWCLTPDAGVNAGSRMHRAAVKALRATHPTTTTLVSYSDPQAGHTGALYRACNWEWAPTWHRLRPPPSGYGSWDGVTQQAPKDRWVFPLRRDHNRADVLRVTDIAAVRQYLVTPEYVETTHRWRLAVPLGAAS